MGRGRRIRVIDERFEAGDREETAWGEAESEDQKGGLARQVKSRYNLLDVSKWLKVK
jgi:hypothetical protein